MSELAVEYRRAVAEADADGATVDLLRQLLGALLLRLTRLPAPKGADRTGAGDEVYRRFQRELERSFATCGNAADYAARAGYSLRTLNPAPSGRRNGPDNSSPTSAGRRLWWSTAVAGDSGPLDELSHQVDQATMRS
ncbi:hypothetical protein [Streptomyces sioyaensis]|uniref:hypothetical protein n=1 Tax=Streptomyces sioyaensis TaxID=67364 RepID=UPI0036E3E141